MKDGNIWTAQPDVSRTSGQRIHVLSELETGSDAEEPTTISTRLMQFTRVDGPWSWTMCLLLLICFLVVFGCSSTYGILFPEVLEELKSGKAITAIPGSLCMANSGIFGPLTGQFYDHFGCTKTILFGGSLSVIGLFSSSYAPNSTLLIFTFGMIFGFGLSLTYMSCMLVVPKYFKKYAFQATSLVSAGPGAALLIMSPIVQRLHQEFGWRKTMKFMAAFSFFTFVVGLAMCVKTSNRESTRHIEQNQINESQSSINKCKLTNFIDVSVFKNKIFVLTTIMITISSLGHMMPFVHLTKYCEDVGIPSKRSSWIYFTIGLSSLLSRFLVGKFGNTGLLTLPHIYQLGICILAVGNLLLPIFREFYLLILYAVSYGVGEGLAYTGSLHVVLDLLPLRSKGAGYGIYVFFVSLTYAAGSPFSGLVADATGSYSYAFYIAGSLEIVGASLQFLSRFIKKQNEEITDDFQRWSDEELAITERETAL